MVGSHLGLASVRGYALATLAVATVLALRLLVHTTIGDSGIFLSFVCAVLVAAVLGGLGPGLLATGFSLLAMQAVWALPSAGGAVPIGSSSFGLHYLFSAVGIGVAYLGGRLHRERVDKAGAEAWSALLEGIVEDSADPIFVKDMHGRYLLANAQACADLHLDRTQVLSRQDDDLLPREQTAKRRALYQRVMETQLPAAVEETMDGPDGTTVRIVSKKPWRDTDGTVVGVIGVARDITERRRVETELEAEEARYRAIIGTAADAIVSIDEAGSITSFNPAAESIFGYTAAEVIGRSIAMLMPLDGSEQHDGHLAAYARTAMGRFIGIGRTADGRHKSGRLIPLELGVGEWHAGGKRFFTGIMRDVSHRRALEDQLRHLALHDGLTQLPNRALLRQQLDMALAAARRHGHKVAVLSFDLDGFKAVNDRLGHAAGDLLLQTVAHRVRATIRTSDTLARLGGDEFTVVQPDARVPDDVAALAGRILEAVIQASPVEEPLAAVTTSIGVAVFPTDGSDAEELLRAADVALYRAKQAGSNRYRFFEPQMDADARSRRSIEGDLRLAMTDQLVLHFQPVIALESGAVAGVEALLRWAHPTRGLLGPGQFLDAAAQMGLMAQIGEWVLQAACEQARAWETAGTPIPVAVNLSRSQLRDVALGSDLEAALARTGLSPSLLEIEIDEAVLAERSLPGHASLLSVALARGIAIGMEGVGEDRGLLAGIRVPAVRRVKFRRELVESLTVDPAAPELLAALVGFAHRLGRTVAGQGVETPAQLRILREQGCDLAQGFLLCPPLPAAELEKRLFGGQPTTANGGLRLVG